MLEKFFDGGIRREGQGKFVVLDAVTGNVEKTWPLPMAGPLYAISENLVYCLCGGKKVVAIDPKTCATHTVISGLSNAAGLTVTADGQILVSLRQPDMQVVAFAPQGKDGFRKIRTYGRKGGRAAVGRWQADGMYRPSGLAVDVEGKLWVAESYEHPKGVSVWSMKDGGRSPTSYDLRIRRQRLGDQPAGPQPDERRGCQWRLDPSTGCSVCLGAFDTCYHNYATFRKGSNGRLYLYTSDGQYGIGNVKVWERLGEANFVLRAELRTSRPTLDPNGHSELWVDKNGDGKEQPAEVQARDGMSCCARAATCGR